jgi:hypothetical protein
MEERATRSKAALNVVEGSAGKRRDERFQSRHVFERTDVDMHMKRTGKFKCDNCVGWADAVQNVCEPGKFVGHDARLCDDGNWFDLGWGVDLFFDVHGMPSRLAQHFDATDTIRCSGG